MKDLLATTKNSGLITFQRSHGQTRPYAILLSTYADDPRRPDREVVEVSLFFSNERKTRIADHIQIQPC